MAVASDQKMDTIPQPYIDRGLIRATLGKSSLGKDYWLGKAGALSRMGARRCIELPIRFLALLRTPGWFINSERCMMYGVTLEAISRRRYDGIQGVGCSTAVVSETVARIHEVEHFMATRARARQGKA